MTRTKGVAARVINYLNARPGQIVQVEDMASELGLKRGQVAQTMWNLRARRPEFGSLETIEAGRKWLWNPNGTEPMPETKYLGNTTNHPSPKPVTQGPVFEVFHKHRNEAVSIETLAAATNLEHEQIRRAISNLRRGGVVGLRTIVTGHVWRYTPDEVPEGTPETPEPEPVRPTTRGLFEQIGTDKKGVILVRGEDDQLYALKPLELDI